MCVCVCVRARARSLALARSLTRACMYTCVCVCVCARAVIDKTVGWLIKRLVDISSPVPYKYQMPTMFKLFVESNINVHAASCSIKCQFLFVFFFRSPIISLGFTTFG